MNPFPTWHLAVLFVAGLCLCSCAQGKISSVDSGGSGDTAVADVPEKPGQILDAAGADAPDTTLADGDGGPTTGPDASQDSHSDVAKDAKTYYKCKGGCPPNYHCEDAWDAGYCDPDSCQLPSQWGQGASGFVQKMNKLEVTGTVLCSSDSDCSKLLPNDVCDPSTKRCKKALDGCDLDGDGTVDNTFNKAFAMYTNLNQFLTTTLVQAGLVMVMEASDFKADGSTFAPHVLLAQPVAKTGCDLPSAATDCEYRILPNSYDLSAVGGNCPARTTLTAKIVNGELQTEPASMSIVLPPPPTDLSALQYLDLTQLSYSGKITSMGNGLPSIAGRICGIMSCTPAMPNCLLDQGGVVKAPLSLSLDYSTISAHVQGMVDK